MRSAGWSVALLVGLLAAPAPTPGDGPPGQDAGAGVLYRLDKGSTFQRGCFDPCDCFLMEEALLQGSFRLIPAGSDWLFEHFTVHKFLAFVPIFGQRTRIAGSGTYSIGGEFARQHRLILDLAVGDDPVRRFDSGLLVGGAEFPAIAIAVSLNGQVCFDTVLEIRASPWRKVRVDAGGIAWDAAAPGVAYDVVRGSVSALRASGGDFTTATEGCLADDFGQTALALADDPPAGEAYFFLLREVGVGGDPSWDEGDAAQVLSRDPGIAAAPASCPGNGP